MSAGWKIRAEARLLREDAPAVLTTGALQALAVSGEAAPPSRATLARWLRELVAATKLVEVIKGVYLNRMGHSGVTPAAAAHHVRARSVVSLAWVLEQEGLTNNFGNTITCVIPTDPSWTNPQVGERRALAATFRFFAMPAALVMEDAGGRLRQDVRDLRFDYSRATAEKALLDWIYLGASPRSRMTRPPLDIEVTRLDPKRLRRIANHMGIDDELDQWLHLQAAHQADPEVQANQSLKFSF